MLVMGLVSLASATVHHKRYECQVADETTTTPAACMPLPFGTAASEGLSLNACHGTCGTGNLWPLPRDAAHVQKVGNVLLNVDACQVTIMNTDASGSKAHDLLVKAKDNFYHSLGQVSGKQFPQTDCSTAATAVEVKVTIEQGDVDLLSLTTDESYVLTATDGVVTIQAPTFFGARHGLETLSQLFLWDEANHKFQLPKMIDIKDAPSKPFRGLMVDTSRQFLPMKVLKETIRAMSYNKMNSLHMHLTDTSSFPIEMPSQPEMAEYGAYGPEEYYSVKDVEEINQYALSHGIRVIPELDIPAHVNAGWQWGEDKGMGKLMVCDTGYSNGKTWGSHALEPPTGQLNIINPNVDTVLAAVYGDFAQMFGSTSDLFHLGGDEIIVGDAENAWASCWNETGNPVAQYIIDSPIMDIHDKHSFYKLWVDFTVKATQMVKDSYEAKGHKLDKILQWAGNHLSEPVILNIFMYPEHYLTACPKEDFLPLLWDPTVESSGEASIAKRLIEDGYEVLLANSDYTYLDCGGPGWVRPGGYWCGPVLEWFKMYDYLPAVKEAWGLTEMQMTKILGAETLIWGETADAENVHQKIWPRTAGMAEAMWSNPGTISSTPGVSERFQQNKHRMNARGIAGQALQPLWCMQNGQSCDVPGWGMQIPKWEVGLACNVRPTGSNDVGAFRGYANLQECKNAAYWAANPV